jgi:prepilin-type N-terminal cleavage/methylation domain-containing protein
MARTATRRVAGTTTPWTSAAGFTLNEMLVVSAIVAVGMAVAIPVTMDMVTRAKNDSAAVVAHTFLDSARDRAIAERRNIRLTFQPPNRILLQREEQPSLALTTVGDMILENGQEFLRYSGMADTPDLFGGAASDDKFTGVEPVMFTSDGSLVDSAGDVTNGTIFMGVPNKPETARAVTVFGVTGMLRSWKWRGTQWFQ